MRFADAVNRLDLAQFESVWTPEATWIIDPPTDYRSSGPRAEITAAFNEGMRTHWKSFSQFVHGTVVELVSTPLRLKREKLNGSGLIFVNVPDAAVGAVCAALVTLGPKVATHGEWSAAQIGF